MPKRKPVYTGRSYEDLAALPDIAPVTIDEFCYWKQISLSKYARDRHSGSIPAVHYVDQAQNCPRHTAADMRTTYSADTKAA